MKLLSNTIYKWLKVPAAVCAVAAMFACQNESPEVPPVVAGDGCTVTIEGSVAVPAMPVLNSRGALAETPGADLKLTLFEFDLGDKTDNSFLSNIYKAEVTSTTAVANKGIVNFKVTLLATTKPKVLHLVVADEYKTWEFAPVADILSSLTVGSTGNETEAYWGRVEFKDGYNEVNEDGSYKVDENNVPVLLSEVKTKLTRVPVIRNFAKIKVSLDPEVTNFELLGFDVVNIPTMGTVAPWNSADQTIPALLDGTNNMKSYTAVSEIYSGILPGSAQFRNTETDAKAWTAASENMNNSDAVYMYEHPYESTRRTYLIVHGKFTTPDGSKDGFYKLDIGKTDGGGFDYYNIIRNIEYNVVIKEVRAPGTTTVSEAIQRAPFNNLIAATETASMLNVSDGQNMLIVNDTNHIIVTDTEKVEVLYRYITGVTSTKEEHNELAHPIDLKAGPVIQSYDDTQTYTDASGAKWKKIVITPNTPTNTVKTQDFTIVDGNGLGRTIHLILRDPWHYAPLKNADGTDSKWIASVAPGSSNLFPFTETITTPDPQPISAQTQQPLTVYFNLPDGLPETMFPLDFYLEAKYQGIENNKIGTLVVTSGPSLFPDNDAITIQYVKTVTYNEYRYQYVGDGQSDIDFNKFNVDHTIRCRFLTITSEEVNDAEILIHNPYFSPDASVTFSRK